MHKISSFCKSVKNEMKEVHWPNVTQTKKDTATVIGTSILFAIFFAIVDTICQWLIGLV